ncbi:penicillin acylase family protein [Massilia sp. G4R7]|uniref:Penicillin acylase family protein n=1 Tax=Massilia phyllostachyos TaxID=2898585 RepID=A0ABS8QBQ0_9BURK|nr:penicillin acylase family protein [Massilia phyllostachyos]MCD2519191.1 penicillin acylase family protein [Massilia phyllostachyos]
MRQPRWKTWTLRGLLALLCLLLLAALGAWLYLRASLAQLDGERRVPGLSAAVTVERDAAGVPLISGNDRFDVAYATGFVHAQERFFQMDLLRRTAAGELAELFGPRALPLDRSRRLHRFRARAERTLARLTVAERALLDRYVAGANDGLNALSTKPFEYALTGTAARPWTATDSLLVVWAMYIDLQGMQEGRDLARGWLREHSDAQQLAFLLPEASGWDATLDGADAPLAAPIPARAPGWWGGAPDTPGKQVALLRGADFVDSVGSNNWVVAGSRSASGAAIVSDDMHLGLQLPNIWYRLALRFPDGKGGQRRIAGVSLPGAPPTVIAGSNGQVAWAFTNSYADLIDLVALGRDPARPGQVRLPGGWETPLSHVETIAVKGAPGERFVVQDTSLGPIRSIGGRDYAMHWVAHDEAAVNMQHLKLEAAANVEEALAIAAVDGIPAQNMVAGDAAGNIGWTIAGTLPARATPAFAATFPLAGEAPTWSGLLPAARYPRIVNPADGQLSSANSRQLMGEGAAAIGDGGFDIGARHRQIASNLRALGAQTGVRQVFEVALDDRALFIAPWRERALRVLDARALQGQPRRAEFRRLLEQSWDGRASVDSVGYRLARGYMWALHDLFYGGAAKAITALDPKAPVAGTTRWPDVVARLLDARPAGWLPAGYADWRAVELAAVDRVIADLTRDGAQLAEASWGARNTAEIAHPVSLAVPALKPFLAAPADRLPGDANMPRVAGPKFGQSERMTVSPGREEEGLYNMPGGQSGHPLSPFFLAGHREWVKAEPVPFLPGKAKYTLRFKP